MDNRNIFETLTNKSSLSDRGLLDMIIYLLPGIKLAEKIKLLQCFESEDDLFIQSKKDIEIILNRPIKTFWDLSEIREKAGHIDTTCAMRSIKWVSWNSCEYPPLLREAFDPPSVIFYRGRLPDPEKPLLGMVGTRKPSRDASEQAYKIADNIGKAGVSVVSGLAYGIDAMSHRGNLASGAPGYAVLGGGIDGIYPASNRPLAKKILDSGGAVISEYPPGFPPGKWTFPARNRIISALSRSVLIVEAPDKSGALITAAFALEQGKDLWVASCGVKESAGIDRRGTIKLVFDGAEIIYSASDILKKWNITEAFSGRADISRPSNREELISSMADLLNIDV
ncbi:MAG: DNA-processing protein DprA [Treponema sp.]|jgi:DNA processing protein|nr:DNA-processing protein DprA [Treponema sp.]